MNAQEYKTKILLAEDEEYHIFIIRKALAAIKDFSYELQVGYDGEEIMSILTGPQRYNPDLILMDIKLPKKNGFELLKEIRQDDDLKMIPIIILTSSARKQDIQDCYKLGCNSYVVKPMNFDKFKEIIYYLYKYWILASTLPTQTDIFVS